MTEAEEYAKWCMRKSMDMNGDVRKLPRDERQYDAKPSEVPCTEPKEASDVQE
jgi:hypothetical protein